MRRLLSVISVAGALMAGSAAARADGLSISADAPTAGLPAVSKDGAWFARPVRVQPSGCAGVQTFVELGEVSAPGTDTKGTLLLVADDCAKTSSIAADNLKKVNESLRTKAFHSVGSLETHALPAEVKAGAATVKVDATGKNRCSVAIDGSASDRWSVQLDGPVTEVRGWYEGKNGAGARYVSVLVATQAKDTGTRGRERWVDFWPVGGAGVGPGTPAEIGMRWLEAMRKGDATAVQELMSAPFWKQGLTPARLKKCKGKQSAKKVKDLGAVASCIAQGVSGFYSKYTGAEYVAEIELAELPDELRKHKKKVAKLVSEGAKLVRYHVNQDGLYAFLILVLDPDTDNQTVAAALESVDVE